MKTLKSKGSILLAGVIIFATSLQVFGQIVLPEITVTASNYKYLNAVNPEEMAQPVNMLERYAATFDVKEAEFYEEDYDKYFVSFFIPEGKILAAYDNNGILLHTAEKYKDIAVPAHIREAVANKYPKWTIAKDVYLVSYYQNKDVTKKIYKLLLKNGDKRIRIKISDDKEFL